MPLTTALARSNPVYAGSKSDWAKLAQANPNKVATIAHENSSRLANAIMAAENVTVTLLELLTIGGTNVALSMWDGAADFRRNELMDAWHNPERYSSEHPAVVARANFEAGGGVYTTETSPFREGGLRDPTVLFGLPKLLWATAGTGALAFFTRRSPYAYVTTGIAVGSLTAFAGSLGREIGMRMAARRAAAAAA